MVFLFDAVYRIVLGPAVILSLLATGGYFSLRLGLPWILHPRRALTLMRAGKSPLSTFRAVTMALAGTLGVGNIAGVSLALMLGGAGSLFWMLVSAFLAMAVKYAEVLLAMSCRKRSVDGWIGGAMYYMRGRHLMGRCLPWLFSLLCVVCAILQGSVIQGSAAAEALSLSIGVKPIFAGIALSLCAFLVLVFGRNGIARVTSVVIPIATLLYMGMCLSVLAVFHEALPSAILSVLRGICTPDAGVGGIIGYLFSAAARQGCAKGLLSNEAGCGTAPMAHVTAEGISPVGQALWGVFEVFLDTAVVCTLTALACLCVLPDGHAEAPIGYVLAVFSPLFGDAAKYLVGFAIVSFAFSTTLTWSFYGASALDTLTHSPGARGLYLGLYCLALTGGAVLSPTLLYTITDILLALMTLINLPILVKKADRVVALSAKEGLIRITRRCGCETAPRRRQMPDGRGSPHTHAR